MSSTYTNYLIRVKTPRGFLSEVWIRAGSYGQAKDMAEAYGEVLGLLESRDE
jgi:hypothetical protein